MGYLGDCASQSQKLRSDGGRVASHWLGWNGGGHLAGDASFPAWRYVIGAGGGPSLWILDWSTFHS